MKYLAELIGEKYTSWKRGSAQFITTPTGSGKTTFVLDNLLEHAIKKELRILYLVNRIILKKQLNEKIRKKHLLGKKNNIQIETYQTLEKMIKEQIYNQKSGPYLFQPVGCQIPVFKYEGNTESILWVDELKYISEKGFNGAYDYIICDECHYFYQDSSYNTNTILSYKWVLEELLLQSKIVLFMSATMTMVKDKVIEDAKRIKNILSQCQNNIANNPDQSPYAGFYNQISGNNPFRYLDRVYKKLDNDDHVGISDYSYILLNGFEKIEDIPSLIELDTNKKWIIFINDIKAGQKIRNEIKDRGISSVVLIHSGYEQDEEAKIVVDEITIKNQMKSQIIITTSVMDNGISIEDIQLRNLIILADTKEDFIQMLGRKRKTKKVEKVNVYICRRTKEYFEKRQDYNNKVFDFINDNFEKTSAELIEKVMSDKRAYGFANQTLYTINGAFAWNEWSTYKVEKLDEYYERLIQRFDEEGDAAFLHEQAEWLGFSADQINMDFMGEKERKLTEKVNAVLQKYCDNELNRDEYSGLVNNIREDLKELLSMNKDKGQEVEKIVNMLNKNDRIISEESFAKIGTYIKLDYVMEKKDKSTYCIIHN